VDAARRAGYLAAMRGDGGPFTIGIPAGFKFPVGEFEARSRSPSQLRLYPREAKSRVRPSRWRSMRAEHNNCNGQAG
jgi:hypothetical protein